MKLLSVNNLSIRFGGLTAVNKVSFSVNQGEIVSLIGPNGAGKTTVFNAITGLLQATEGEILLRDRTLARPVNAKSIALHAGCGALAALLLVAGINAESVFDAAVIANYSYQQAFPWGRALESAWQLLRNSEQLYTGVPALAGFFVGASGSWSLWQTSRRTPDVVIGQGIARTFQNIRLFPKLTALENVVLGTERYLRSNLIDAIFHLPRSRRERKESETAAWELLKFVGLEKMGLHPAQSLPYGYQRRLEIARALASKPDIILLDEPAAGMNPTESAELLDLIRNIRQRGCTVLLIEHDMKVVMNISDRIVVLDYGNKIAEGTPQEVKREACVIKAYLGSEI